MANENLKIKSSLSYTEQSLNARIAINNGFVPKSIKKEMDLLGINKLADVPKAIAIHAAEAAHDPNKGIIMGLNDLEIEAIRKLDPERAKEYDKMKISEANQRNLKYEKLELSRSINNLFIDYNIALEEQGNIFSRLFMSKEQIIERDKAVRIAIMRLETATKQYEMLKKNKISYRTILQWQEGQLP